MKKKANIVYILMCLSISVSACGPSQTDLDATATQGMEDYFATQTAAPTEIPTSTPTPTITPTATNTPVYEIGSKLTRPSDNMIMVYVPEGEFEMGSMEGDPDEQPVHTVFLDAYWIDAYEVTVDQYGKCKDAGVCVKGGGMYPNKNIPANVDWKQANTYCQWVGGRLPTEAEWEKAARGTDGRIYPWGDTIGFTFLNAGKKRVLSSQQGSEWIKSVGSYPLGASPYGALDMAGNYSEWVADYYDENYYSISPASNPRGPDEGYGHVLRGGAFDSDAYSVRSANRELFPTWDNTGFRCVVDP